MTKTWIDVGAVQDVPHCGARVVKTATGGVAVFKTQDGAIFALRDQCPHKGGPLSQGIVHDRFVTCPLHNWIISLETGAATGADVGGTAKIATMIESGRILLSAADIAGGAE